jgi:uncharacterized protein (TIGR00369 family)
VTIPIVSGRSEALFGVHDISQDGHRVSVRARPVPWDEGCGGDAPAGTLGVLADNASGYAIISGAPPGHWSVTTELTLDIVGRLPADGSELVAVAELLNSSETTGYSSGTIEDCRGRTIAHIRQRGLYLPGIPAPPHRPEPETLETGIGCMGALFGQSPGSDAFPMVDVEVNDVLVNPMGNLHGGVGACLAEWVAAASWRDGGSAPLRTTSIHVVYLRPAPLGTTVRVEATVKHRGRNLGLSEVTATDAQGKGILHATVTAGSV